MPSLKGEVPAKWAVGFNNADFGRFNLWRPIVVNRTRGSNRLSALPTGSAGMSFPGKFRKIAEFGNSNLWFPNSSPEPAAASGTGHCPAAASGCRHCLPGASTDSKLSLASVSREA